MAAVCRKVSVVMVDSNRHGVENIWMMCRGMCHIIRKHFSTPEAPIIIPEIYKSVVKFNVDGGVSILS